MINHIPNDDHHTNESMIKHFLKAWSWLMHNLSTWWVEVIILFELDEEYGLGFSLERWSRKCIKCSFKVDFGI